MMEVRVTYTTKLEFAKRAREITTKRERVITAIRKAVLRKEDWKGRFSLVMDPIEGETGDENYKRAMKLAKEELSRRFGSTVTATEITFLAVVGNELEEIWRKEKQQYNTEEHERGTQGLVTPARPELQEQLASKVDAPIRYAEPNAAIILKRLPPNEQTRPGMQRVLILDYRGIFCTVRIPVEALNDAERELEQYKKTLNPLGVIVFSTNEEGFLMGPMGITEAERKALDMVEQYFEATGCSMDAIPTDVISILARAKVLMPARSSENANP